MEAEYRISVCDDIVADRAQIVSATEEIMAAQNKTCRIEAYAYFNR